MSDLTSKSTHRPIISANHLSAVRMIFIPFVCYLLFISKLPAVRLTAFIMYILLGVTDYFDGVLARKYGETKFGALLDHFSDKIFVVLFFATIGFIGLIPFWLSLLIIIRDPLICGLRFLSKLKGFNIEVVGLAKYKTAIQIFGGGYILFISDHMSAEFAYACMVLVSLVGFAIFVHSLIVKRRFRLRVFSFLILTLFAFVCRYYFSSQTAALIYGLVILFATWLSAVHYFGIFALKFRQGKGSISLAWWLISLLESIALPIILLILIGTHTLSPWLLMIVLAIEFLASACNYIAASEDAMHRPNVFAIKLLLQYFFIILLSLKIWLPCSVPPLLNYAPIADVYLLMITTFSFFLFILSTRQATILEHMTDE